jgi:hypothetical protein
MKTNFKTGEKVKVTKAGMFKDLEGTVLANNIDTPMKPLTVILADLGTWSFSYSEVISLSKETTIQEIKMPKKNANFDIQKDVYKILTEAKPIIEKATGKKVELEEVKTKRQYVKRDPKAIVKPKRKYTKRK